MKNITSTYLTTTMKQNLIITNLQFKQMLFEEIIL